MDILQYPFDGALILQKKRALRKALLEQPGLTDKRIAIVGGSTVGDIRKVLELFLLRLGIRPTFYEGGYGLFYENIVFDDGSLAEFKPDILYIHTSNRNLRLWPTPADSEADADAKLEDEFNRFAQVWQAAQRFGCPVIQNNFELPGWRNFGNLDASDKRGRVRHVRRMNERLAGYAESHPALYIHDLDYLASAHGLDAWCDSSAWYAYKYCCAPAFIPALCNSLAALMGAMLGRSKKSVVLDLDNTLWGGVIGEVGPEGIELGDETPAGMAYADLQRYLKTLAQRGVLLNVASKNEEANALAGFAREDSPLKREDFIEFAASWEPKTRSIAAMAQNINILPDSFVFMDDNPAERELVNQELPGVVTPEVTTPEFSIGLLDRAGYFEAAAVSADDKKRGEMYRQNAARREQEASFGNYEEYLKSLAMTAAITPFAPEQLERITQLINKTNQFNLTTRRYTLAETTAAMEDVDQITLAGRLVDKFGDNGLVSVIIGSIEDDTLDVDLWIMSCRVFKRHLEYAMFDALVEQAKKRGVKTIRGRYLPTAKNLLTRDFYATIGFVLLAELEDGTREFALDVQNVAEPYNKVIKIEEKQ